MKANCGGIVASMLAIASDTADRQPGRCMSCHKSREQQDFVPIIDQMRNTL